MKGTDFLVTTQYLKNGAWHAAEAGESGSFSADDFQLSVRASQKRQEQLHIETFEVRGEFCAGKFAPFTIGLKLPRGFRCVFKPHMTPKENMIIAEDVFRCPAILLENEEQVIALIPDFSCMEQPHPVPYMMNFVPATSELLIGLSRFDRFGHVYFTINDQPVLETVPVNFRFQIVSYTKPENSPARDCRPIVQYIWQQFGRDKMQESPDPKELGCYVGHAYRWAFESWKDVVWQEFTIGEKTVGGVVFIVCTRQKPGRGHEQEWREPKSLWNQAWFCSLRSAYGYRLYGMESGNRDLIEKSEKALNFALAAPQHNGLFPGYFEADEHNDFSKGHWVNACPRRPENHENYVHLLDSSWTVYWLLKWYQDIEARQDIYEYAQRYLETLMQLAREDGSFPAWVDPKTLKCSEFLTVSPEAAVHVMLLCLWAKLTKDEKVRMQIAPMVQKTGCFLDQNIVREGRWEDFETYYSCAKEWEGRQYGQKTGRDGIYNQCTFGMYWCAEAFLSIYQLTGDDGMLDAGRRVVAELSLYQQLCHPHRFGDIPTLGGFAAMNSDDELNDARQSLIALTYLRYYIETREEEYRQRALWAMKASFYMMYCPENKSVKALFEKVHPFMDAKDYGFQMENFNHHDGTCVDGIGEFTIFDWGNGAASSSLMEFLELWQIAEGK